jgi:signal transduction histidine kinase
MVSVMSYSKLCDHFFLNELFPFYILYDDKGEILNHGVSIEKIFKTIKKINFFDQFVVKTPHNCDSNFSSILKNRKSVFILVDNGPFKIRLSGQMYFDEENSLCAFLGAPLINDANDLKDLNLSLDDFSLHDGTMRNMFALQMTNSSLADTRKITKQLKISNKELRQFSYIATHDLKVPISNLEGYYQFLKNDLKTTNVDLLDTVYWIGKSIDQAKRTINDLLKVTELDYRELSVERINIHASLSSVLADFAREIREIKMSVSVEIEKDSYINYDSISLKSIFMNIVGNAIKYNSPERLSKLDIRIEESKTTWILSFSDNGLGINLEKDGDKVFGLFKRIHDHKEGSGIGLYMTKKIIENNKGTIECISELDKGTSFVITLTK